MSIFRYPEVSPALARALLPRDVDELPGWYDDGNRECAAVYKRTEVEGWIDQGLAHARVNQRVVTRLVFQHPEDGYLRHVFIQDDPTLYHDNLRVKNASGYLYMLRIEDIVSVEKWMR